jgi:hypothetical protein
VFVLSNGWEVHPGWKAPGCQPIRGKRPRNGPAPTRGFVVKKADDYRKHAEECLQLMKQMVQQEHRQMLEEMAQIWLKMAADREHHIDRSDAA